MTLQINQNEANNVHSREIKDFSSTGQHNSRFLDLHFHTTITSLSRFFVEEHNEIFFWLHKEIQLLYHFPRIFSPLSFHPLLIVDLLSLSLLCFFKALKSLLSATASQAEQSISYCTSMRYYCPLFSHFSLLSCHRHLF